MYINRCIYIQIIYFFEINCKQSLLFPCGYVAPVMDAAFTPCHLSDGALRLNASQEIPSQLVLTECASAGHLLEKKDVCMDVHVNVCTYE